MHAVRGSWRETPQPATESDLDLVCRILRPQILVALRHVLWGFPLSLPIWVYGIRHIVLCGEAIFVGNLGTATITGLII